MSSGAERSRSRGQGVGVPLWLWENSISKKVTGMRRVTETLLPPMPPTVMHCQVPIQRHALDLQKAPGCTGRLLVGPYGPRALVP